MKAQTEERDPLTIVQEARRVPGPVLTGVKNLTFTGIRPPDRPAGSESLFRLLFLGPRRSNLRGLEL